MQVNLVSSALLLHTRASFFSTTFLVQICVKADQLLTWYVCDHQVALTRQGLPEKALHAVRMLLAPARLTEQHAASDFQKQVDALHEESCLQVRHVCVRLFVGADVTAFDHSCHFKLPWLSADLVLSH